MVSSMSSAKSDQSEALEASTSIRFSSSPCLLAADHTPDLVKQKQRRKLRKRRMTKATARYPTGKTRKRHDSTSWDDGDSKNSGFNTVVFSNS